MFKTVCTIYLNDEKHAIMMDDIQENIYKLNLETMDLIKYSDKSAMDEFLFDMDDSTVKPILISHDFHQFCIDYTCSNYENGDFYIHMNNFLGDLNNFSIFF